MLKQPRPLSPHLQIYKPQIGSVLSILHRFTGVYLSLGAYVLALWVGFLAFCQEGLTTLNLFFGTVFGQLLLMSWTLAFFYHLANGVRHLFWDIGVGYDLKTMKKTGWVVLAVACMLTLLVWSWIFARWGL